MSVREDGFGLQRRQSMMNENRKLRLLRKIKTYRELSFKETLINIESEREIQQNMKRKQKLESLIKNTVNRMFPSLYRTIIHDVELYRMDFYLNDVPKMLMNDAYDGILMTRKKGVLFLCLGTEEERVLLDFYTRNSEVVGFYEVKDGVRERELTVQQAKQLFKTYEEKLSKKAK